MIGRDAIDEKAWKMILAARDELMGYLPRLAKVPREMVEDAIGDGMVDVIVAFDPAEVAAAAKAQNIGMDGQIAILMKNAAMKRLGQARRVFDKTISDDTPILTDDDDLHMRDLFVARQNSAERIENYAEWTMLSRKGRCPLTKQEIDSLFGFENMEGKR